jgi:hypothetical protein
LRALVSLFAVLLAGCVPAAPHDALRVVVAPDGASVELLGLAPRELDALGQLSDEARAQALRAYVGVDESDDVPPMLGDVSIAGRALRFTPRFALTPGTQYRLAYRDAVTLVTFPFSMADRPQGAPTSITRIYPTADSLPENQLKFYIHFSAPMGRGEAYRHLHLLGPAGEVDLPFLELGEELWDKAMRRFTLLFDPGRIKRGLKPREEVGPVLEEGQHYTLVVDRDWPDAQGRPLSAEARKSFHVLPPAGAPLDTATWRFESPPASSHSPLVVRFPRPLDHALLERMLWITDASRRKLAGAIEISDAETCWQFTPTEPWSAGNYQLVADVELEDLAGNSIARAFDVDVFDPVQTHIETKTVAVPFEVK